MDVSGKLSQDDLLGGGQCISDLSVTVWGTEVSLPMSRICPGLEYMGWVLVAVSSLAGFRIVSGVARE
ncbi:virulence factor TspB C-terminal domain-related protein [Delftia tsuruhatensis]|uniref:virulence factor TspB C-terminal domain-related protein n=1 Tax=Delftia tsuruhatensis TaxID=180282 RepID=UPI00387EA090